MRYLSVGTETIVSLFYTSDQSSLVCVEKDNSGQLRQKAVHWFDPHTGERQRTLNLCEDAWRRTISYADECDDTHRAFVSPDGRWVAVQRFIGDRGKLNLWDGKSEKWRDIDLVDAFGADGVCYSAQGDFIYATYTDTDSESTGTALERLNLNTNSRLPTIPFPQHSWAKNFRFNADETRLAVVAQKQTIGGMILVRPYEWDRADVSDWVELDNYINESAVVQFSPQGSQLAIMNKAEIIFWDWETGQCVLMATERIRFTDLVYSADHRFFALACEDGTIRLHDSVTHEEMKRYDWGIGRIGCVAFASDGLTAAAGGENGQVVVWDLDC